MRFAYRVIRYTLRDMRLMGIDYGTKKVGIALSDEGGRVAFPKAVLPNDAAILAALTELCARENVSGIVLGESNDFRGEPNPVMADITKFKKKLERKAALPVHFEAEFLTSAGAGRVGKEDSMRDARAAALILQRFLDRSR